jgi:hypothetical protein
MAKINVSAGNGFKFYGGQLPLRLSDIPSNEDGATSTTSPVLPPKKIDAQGAHPTDLNTIILCRPLRREHHKSTR